MSLTLFDRGMKNLLLSGNDDVKKYIVTNKANKIDIDNYYTRCKNRKRPYITINKGRVYSNLELDCITLPLKWDKYIHNKVDGYDANFNLALEKMGITKNEKIIYGLDFYFSLKVKNEYVESIATFLYNLYEIWIIELLHDTEVKLKQKKRQLKHYKSLGETTESIENEIKNLNDILGENEKL